MNSISQMRTGAVETLRKLARRQGKLIAAAVVAAVPATLVAQSPAGATLLPPRPMPSPAYPFLTGSAVPSGQLNVLPGARPQSTETSTVAPVASPAPAAALAVARGAMDPPDTG